MGNSIKAATCCSIKGVNLQGGHKLSLKNSDICDKAESIIQTNISNNRRDFYGLKYIFSEIPILTF